MFEAVVDEIDLNAFQRSWHVENFLAGETKRQLLERYFFQPTLNIDGLTTGYTGPGSKTVLPYNARAKIDMRLVPDMDPHDIVAKIRLHLDERGYEGIRIHINSANPACQTNPDSEIIRAAVRAMRPFGVEAKPWPRNMGFFPAYIFGGPPLNLDFCVAGLGHGARAHGPDEYFVIEGDGRVKGLREMEQSYARVLYEFAAGTRG